MALSSHVKRILITGAGVLILSPDALLVRLIGAGDWTIVFYRGLLVAVSLSLFLTVQGKAVAAWRGMGLAGLLGALLFACSNAFFVHSVNSTLVAKTLVVLSATPLIAALLGRVFLGESVRRETWAAICVVVIGVCGIFFDGLATGSLKGDLFALVTASAMAGTLVALRRVRAESVLPVLSAGSILAAMVATFFAAPLTVSTADLALLCVLGLLVLPVSFGLIFYGPKFLPAPEVALLMLLETVLGPIWVWLVLGESPSYRVLLAGGLIIATVIIHAAVSLRLRARDGPPWPSGYRVGTGS